MAELKNPFKNIRAARGDAEKSLRWYQNQVTTLQNVRPGRLIQQNQAAVVSQILPGYMYLFGYDPKHKETLPFYDIFPLVIPFRKVKDGFYGMNLHYLPYTWRFKLLGKLNEFATGDDEKGRLILSWKLLNASSRLREIQPCVKHYLNNHLQTRFLQIPMPDWITAAMLPIERFRGDTKQAVWQQSLRQIR